MLAIVKCTTEMGADWLGLSYWKLNLGVVSDTLRDTPLNLTKVSEDFYTATGRAVAVSVIELLHHVIPVRLCRTLGREDVVIRFI